jgi:hypothetical protein
MKIVQKKFCVFVVWIPIGIKTETIFFDKQFWEEQTFQNYKNFFTIVYYLRSWTQGIQEDQLEIRNLLLIVNKSKKIK